MPRRAALLSLGLMALAMIAFWPMYLSRSWADVDAYTHIHAMLGTVWLVAMVAQPLLILRGRKAMHRWVGRAALVVATGFVVSGLLLTHYRVRRLSEAAYATEGIYIYLPLSVAIAFGIACVLGYRWRHSAAVHARFMLSTGLLLIDPVVARIMYFNLPRLPRDYLYQGITFTIMALAMVLLVKSAPAKAPGRRAYRHYCVGTMALLALYFVVPDTAAWRAFVDWFRAIPLT